MHKSRTIDRVKSVIRGFLEMNDRECPILSDDTKLHQQAGLSSDEGVCIVLELSSEFGVEIPDDFNAVVHENGQRSRTVAELAVYITGCKEAS